MKRLLLACSLIALGFGLVGCSSTTHDGNPENLGTEEQRLSKCAGGVLGNGSYCTSTCKCDLGEGDCDGPAECNNGLSCNGNGLYFYGQPGNVCAPAYCKDHVQDGDETQVDCGGSCGSMCPNQCLTVPANGLAGHCTSACPCVDNQGDCAANPLACNSGFCKVDSGASFGFSATIDMCLPTHCNNGILDSGETGVDCGGTCTVACVAGDVQSAGFGGTLNDHGQKVVFDSSGDFIVAGYFSGTANFGGANLVSAGSSDIYVAKYNALGVHQWSKSFGGTGPDGDQGVYVTVDGSKNVIVGGNFWNSVNFGGGVLTSAGSTDMFVVKLTTAGAYVTSKRFGGTGADRISGIAAASSGEWFISGMFQNSVAFGSATLTSAGLDDAIVFKTSSAGTVSWRKQIGSTGKDLAHAVVLDSSGNVYVAGSFSGTVDFGTGPKVSNAGSVDGYAMKLTNAGVIQWVNTYGSKNVDQVLGVTVDALKQPTFVGRFTNSVDFGAGMVASAGGTDVFVVGLTATGAYRWADTLGSTSNDLPFAAAADASNNVFVVGQFAGTMSFDSGAITTNSTGGGFLVKYNSAGTGLFATALGGTAVAVPTGVAAKPGKIIVTGDFSGSANFGSGSVTSKGLLDMFWAKFNN